MHNGLDPSLYLRKRVPLHISPAVAGPDQLLGCV